VVAVCDPVSCVPLAYAIVREWLWMGAVRADI